MLTSGIILRLVPLIQIRAKYHLSFKQFMNSSIMVNDPYNSTVCLFYISAIVPVSFFTAAIFANAMMWINLIIRFGTKHAERKIKCIHITLIINFLNIIAIGILYSIVICSNEVSPLTDEIGFLGYNLLLCLY